MIEFYLYSGLIAFCVYIASINKEEAERFASVSWWLKLCIAVIGVVLWPILVYDVCQKRL